MNERAQAGLEYLMTYGWALILVATIVVVLAFIVQFKPTTTFVSSDPTKIMLKSAGVSGNTAGIVLQNATGGRITINSIIFSGDVLLASGSTLNGQSQPSFPVDIIAGGEIRLDGLNAANGAANARIAINYKDYADFEREARVTSGAGAPEGIAAAYSFEGDAFDGSGNNNNGTVSGALEADCVSGTCLKVGSSVDGGNESKKVANESYTYIAWIKPTAFTCSGGSSYNLCEIISKIDVWSNGSNFGVSNSAALAGYRQTASSTYLSSNSTVTIAKDQWQFVATSLDNTGEYIDRTIHLYLNGKDITANASYALGDLQDTSTLSLTIGKSFDGFIDEVRIYDRALSAAEICNECKRFASNVAAIQPGFACGC